MVLFEEEKNSEQSVYAAKSCLGVTLFMVSEGLWEMLGQDFAVVCAVDGWPSISIKHAQTKGPLLVLAF